MSSRLNSREHGAKAIIMQRLHEEDLSGFVLEEGGYEHLRLPLEFEPQRRAVTCLGSDPREHAGEVLFPELLPASKIPEIKREIGSMGYAGQYQQRPAPEGGGILKRHWWHYWQRPGVKLSPISIRTPEGEVVTTEAIEQPAAFDTIIQSWDLAFKDLETSSYVVGQVWGKKGADRFLLDQVRKRMDCPETMQAIRELTARWPNAELKLVEEKANGAAVIQMLRHEIPGIVAVEPEGGKVARAYAVSPQIESGNVYLPHPSMVGWVDGFLGECDAFPNAMFDDQVDAMTQALYQLRHRAEPRVRRFEDPWEQ